jgi:hypothetical protein
MNMNPMRSALSFSLLLALSLFLFVACGDDDSSLKSRIAQIYDKESYQPGDVPAYSLQYDAQGRVSVVTVVRPLQFQSSQFQVFYGIDERISEIVQYTYPDKVLVEVNYFDWTNFGFIIRNTNNDSLVNASSYYITSKNQISRIISYDENGLSQTHSMYWAEDTLMTSSDGYSFVYRRIESPLSSIDLPILVVTNLFPALITEMQSHYLPVVIQVPTDSVIYTTKFTFDSDSLLQALEVKRESNRYAIYSFNYQIYRE